MILTVQIRCDEQGFATDFLVSGYSDGERVQWYQSTAFDPDDVEVKLVRALDELVALAVAKRVVPPGTVTVAWMG